MARVTIVDPATSTGETKELFDTLRRQVGGIPNFTRVLANSPRALEGFYELWTNLGRGELSKATQERIALAMAERNGCQYCVSAHTALGKGAGLSDAEIEAARNGTSEADRKADALVRFSRQLLDNMGEVSVADFNAIRAAGATDGEIVEVVAHVGLNVLTNVLGKSTKVEVDFPKVELLDYADAAAA